MQGDDRAVQIGGDHTVVVDECQHPYPTACQHLDHIAANAANAEHDDARPTEPFHCLWSEQQLCSCELIFHIALQN